MMRPFIIEGDLAKVADSIEQWALDQPRWAVVKDSNSVSKIHLTRTSRVFRFVDDLQITLTASGEGKVQVNATSQSRVGIGDFGQNRRNLLELAHEFTQRSQPQAGSLCHTQKRSRGQRSRGQRSRGTERMTSFERESLGIWTTKTRRHQEKLCALVPWWFPSISLS